MPASFRLSSRPSCWAAWSPRSLPACCPDWMGRKKMMALSGALFVASIPLIALSHSYGSLVFGRLLQGVSGGLIGVVIPLYLAECLDAKDRGKGTGVFQWMLVFGFVIAAVIALYFSYRVDAVAKLGRREDAARFQGRGVAQHFLGFPAARGALCPRQFCRGRVAALAFPARPQGCGPRRAAALAGSAAGRSRVAGNGGQRRGEQGGGRRTGQGIAAQPPIRDSVHPRVRDPRVQPGHGHQLDHRVQREYLHPERAFRRPGALRQPALHARQLLHDDGRGHARGSQGSQVPAVRRHGRHHRFADRGRPAFPPH